MLLDLRHWQMLTAIDEAGTVRAAAERLGLTQSALSHRLAEAERRLGGALFTRRGRALEVTPAGRLLTQAAGRLLPALDRAEREAIAMVEGAARLVRLGVAHYAAFHWLPAFLAWRQSSVPDIALEVVAAASEKPLRSLHDGSVDLLIAPTHVAGPGTAAVHLFDDELVLLLPPDHPLATRDRVEARDLFDQDYLTYGRSSEPGFEYDRFFRPRDEYPRTFNMVELTGAIVELVAAGMGVSILARWATRRDALAGRVVQVPLGETGLDLSWSAVVRDGEAPRSAARRLAMALARWSRETGGFTA